LGVFFFFLACSAVDDDSGDDDDVAIGVIGRNVLWKFVTRGADDEEVGLFGMVKQSEGVMPSATRSSARGRTSFMIVVVVVVVFI